MKFTYASMSAAAMLLLHATSSMAATTPVKARDGSAKLVARDDYSMVCVMGGTACSGKSPSVSALCNLTGCKFSGGDCKDDGTLEGGADVWCNQCHCEED
ncbi:hypothetical protein HBI56_235310 [Parastagonospora nodorum]|nr:hypothetical protein HBH53_243260 [Parastagonospora nodorum]KAH3959018.1 hypothetical protein HBH51_203790 [Parastagonospora nodorum]KAH3963613.1 hypothetical protein HBH52_218110 [Parastagonospora nodorum]KAH4010950.1 hypothetical protein HBI09_229440 [Parastagonospora nodorum]KAH4079022.1 hypothetical protein HBH46_234850 [Parastagonospora nodorum]